MTDFPFNIGKGEHYIPSLNALNRIYTQHPDFKPSTKLIYELLFDYYNPKYKYAFPTFRQLERDSGLGVATVKRQVKVLERLDLVEIGRGAHGNNTYVVKRPLQTLGQLYERFPEIETESRERLRKIDEADEVEKNRRKGAQPDPDIDETFF